MEDLNKVASEYLVEQWKRHAAKFVLSRYAAPQYFVGVKRDGRAIFTHDPKLAAHFEDGDESLHESITKLQEAKIEVTPIVVLPAEEFRTGALYARSEGR